MAGSGSRIGRYRLESEVGRGGMGIVWKAHDPSLDRHVAIKQLRSDGPQQAQDVRARFLREARLAARLRHPNITAVHEVIERGTTLILVMDFIDGVPLGDWLQGKGRPARAKPTYEQVSRVIEACARALAAAHAENVVHRDVKPANILVDRADHPYLTDFGLARDHEFNNPDIASRSGILLGTPLYMSPEQAEGKHRGVGPLSDVFSLGAVLYTALAGVAPFAADSIYGIIERILFQEPVPLSQIDPMVPPDLEAICLKALAKDPAARHPSALAMAEALARFAPPVAPRPASGIRRKRPGAARKQPRWIVPATIAGAVAIVAAGGWWISTRGRTTPASTPAAAAQTTPAPAQLPVVVPPPAGPTAADLLAEARRRPMEDAAAWEKSVALLDRAVKLDARCGDAWYERGVLLERLRRCPEAIESYGKAIDAGGPVARARFARAAIRADNDVDFEAARPDLEALLMDFPDSDFALLAKARIAMDRQDFQAALKACEAVIARTKTLDEAYGMAGCCCQQHSIDTAERSEAFLSKAIELNPWRSQWWGSRGAARYEQKRYDPALADCEKAIALAPHLGWAYEVKGAILGALGRCQASLEAFEAAVVRKGPPTARVRFGRSLALAGCAQALYDGGKKDEAKKMLATAITDVEFFLGTSPKGSMADYAKRHAARLHELSAKW